MGTRVRARTSNRDIEFPGVNFLVFAKVFDGIKEVYSYDCIGANNLSLIQV